MTTSKTSSNIPLPVETRTRPTAFLVAMILFTAILLRIVLALLHPFSFPDSADYDALAKTILHHQPYQTNFLYATRMPGYPVFVALIYTLFGATMKPVLITQALMGGAVTALVFLIARRINSTLALIAAALAAIDPLSIGFSAAFLSEAPFTLLMVASLWLLLQITDNDSPQWPRWIAIGLLWAAAVYMRASALWLIVPLSLWSAWRIKKRLTLRDGFLTFTGPLLSVALVLLSLLPWQYRNDQLFHDHFFRLTTLEGISLYEAVYPGADGSPKQDLIHPSEYMTEQNEAERNDYWSYEAQQYIVSDPLRIAALAGIKIARTWSPWMNAADFQKPTLQIALTLWHIPLFIFALIGVFAGAISRKIKGMLLIPIFYFTAVHALFLGSVRYRVPLMPLVCIFAAVGISASLQRLAHKPAPAPTV